ncbi:hypothetical protein BC629DRAFT_1556628 [Irpex lacteus]|nr:hypothetical protein BC629DRAFT_1556628 [Irpex lacteus]
MAVHLAVKRESTKITILPPATNSIASMQCPQFGLGLEPIGTLEFICPHLPGSHFLLINLVCYIAKQVERRSSVVFARLEPEKQVLCHRRSREYNFGRHRRRSKRFRGGTIRECQVLVEDYILEQISILNQGWSKYAVGLIRPWPSWAYNLQAHVFKQQANCEWVACTPKRPSSHTFKAFEQFKLEIKEYVHSFTIFEAKVVLASCGPVTAGLTLAA